MPACRDILQPGIVLIPSLERVTVRGAVRDIQERHKLIGTRMLQGITPEWRLIAGGILLEHVMHTIPAAPTRRQPERQGHGLDRRTPESPIVGEIEPGYRQSEADTRTPGEQKERKPRRRT